MIDDQVAGFAVEPFEAAAFRDLAFHHIALGVDLGAKTDRTLLPGSECARRILAEYELRRSSILRIADVG
jgi:hypothetical protein